MKPWFKKPSGAYFFLCLIFFLRFLCLCFFIFLRFLFRPQGMKITCYNYG